MKKEGVIFFNENLKRYDISFLKETDGENYGELHAGVSLNGAMVNLLNGKL